MFRNSYILVVLLLAFSLGCAQAATAVSNKIKDLQEAQKQRELRAKELRAKELRDSTETPSETKEVSAAQAAVPTRREELTFTLTDNSVIIGKILQEGLPFDSQLGQHKVNGEDIASFKEGILRLEDGTVLKGSFTIESVGIKSEFGEIQTKVSNILSIVR